MKHYIIGHQKPDADSTIAAISLTDYFHQVGDDTATAVICDPINPETTFIFQKFSVSTPPPLIANQIATEDRIVLVDHNEEDQRLPNINPDQITGIVDHHKANINFSHPITIDIKPWGSTNTIIYFKFKNKNLQVDQKLASLMLCAILSDTVGLKSSTTTEKDKQAVTELATLAGINDIDNLTLEIFKAKSNISSLTPEQIVENDYKIFDFARKTFIGQLETVEQDEVLNRKKELLEAMQEIKQQQGVQLLFLAITDILKINTKLLILGNEEKGIAQKAFSGIATDNVLDIGAKLSRKKDIAPPIEEALK